MFIDSPHSFVLPLFSLSIERRVKLTDGKVKGLMETSCKNGYYNIASRTIENQCIVT